MSDKSKDEEKRHSDLLPSYGTQLSGIQQCLSTDLFANPTPPEPAQGKASEIEQTLTPSEPTVTLQVHYATSSEAMQTVLTSLIEDLSDLHKGHDPKDSKVSDCGESLTSQQGSLGALSAEHDKSPASEAAHPPDEPVTGDFPGFSNTAEILWWIESWARERRLKMEFEEAARQHLAAFNDIRRASHSSTNPPPAPLQTAIEPVNPGIGVPTSHALRTMLLDMPMPCSVSPTHRGTDSLSGLHREGPLQPPTTHSNIRLNGPTPDADRRRFQLAATGGSGNSLHRDPSSLMTSFQGSPHVPLSSSGSSAPAAPMQVSLQPPSSFASPGDRSVFSPPEALAHHGSPLFSSSQGAGSTVFSNQTTTTEGSFIQRRQSTDLVRAPQQLALRMPSFRRSSEAGASPNLYFGFPTSFRLDPDAASPSWSRRASMVGPLGTPLGDSLVCDQFMLDNNSRRSSLMPVGARIPSFTFGHTSDGRRLSTRSPRLSTPQEDTMAPSRTKNPTVSPNGGAESAQSRLAVDLMDSMIGDDNDSIASPAREMSPNVSFVPSAKFRRSSFGGQPESSVFHSPNNDDVLNLAAVREKSSRESSPPPPNRQGTGIPKPHLAASTASLVQQHSLHGSGHLFTPPPPGRRSTLRPEASITTNAYSSDAGSPPGSPEMPGSPVIQHFPVANVAAIPLDDLDPRIRFCVTKSRNLLEIGQRTRAQLAVRGGGTEPLTIAIHAATPGELIAAIHAVESSIAQAIQHVEPLQPSDDDEPVSVKTPRFDSEPPCETRDEK